MGLGNSKGTKFGPHKHSLHLREIKCKLCAKPVVALFYACDSCNYYVHKSCGDLSLQIKHSFHPSHTDLYLFRGVTDRCYSCYKDFEDSPFYKCEKCDFKMDVECAMIAPSEQGLKHFSHPHSLVSFVVENDNDDTKCFACDEKLSDSAFGCDHCGYFLHKSCAKTPTGSFLSQHPLHSLHDGLSPAVSIDSFTCAVCETKKQDRCNFNFKCCQCEFRLCWSCCVRVKRSIRFEDHEHALCFVEKTGDKSLDQCNGYEAYCRQPLISKNCEDFKRSKSSIFRCLDCDFKLHLLCGPLPSTVKHECHIHALTLLDSLVDDDSGEYYCDVCETERDPRIRLYYCEECKYSAHVHCIISEIVNILRGDLDGVELIALGDDTWTRTEMDKQEDHDSSSTATTLKDLLDQIVDKKEKEELKSYYKWDKSWSNKANKAEKPPMEKGRYLNDKEMNEILKLSSFTAGDFIKWCGELQKHHSKWSMELTGSDLELKMVRVKGYTIPRSLAGVLETLLNEHGDHIIGGSTLSVEMKSVVLFVLCRVVKKMRSTLVQDVTKYLLREWFYHLSFVKSQGFEIGFALAQAESLVDAFLGLQAERLKDEIPKELGKKMAEVKQKMDKLQEKMGGLKQNLEKCEQFCRPMSQKSEYMKYCLKIASKFRWPNAFDRLVSESPSVPRENWEW